MVNKRLREALPALKQGFFMRAQEILNLGNQTLEARAQSYDAPHGERSIEKTVKLFNALTGHKLTEAQGWKFMVCLKLVRSEQGKYQADNFVDGAAYFGLAGEASADASIENTER